MIEYLNLNKQDTKYNVQNENAQLNGIYGLISESTETIFENNIIEGGNSYVLALDNSKTLMEENTLYPEFIKIFIPSSTVTLSASTDITVTDFNIDAEEYSINYDKKIKNEIEFIKKYPNFTHEEISANISHIPGDQLAKRKRCVRRSFTMLYV